MLDITMLEKVNQQNAAKRYSKKNKEEKVNRRFAIIFFVAIGLMLITTLFMSFPKEAKAKTEYKAQGIVWQLGQIELTSSEAQGNIYIYNTDIPCGTKVTVYMSSNGTEDVNDDIVLNVEKE